MDRLTKAISKLENFHENELAYGEDAIMPYENCEVIIGWLKELKAYRDAGEQGWPQKPPVLIGEIVYRINGGSENPIIPMGVTEIIIKGLTDTFKEIKCKDCVYGGEHIYRFTDIDEKVFLSKEKAVESLKVSPKSLHMNIPYSSMLNAVQSAPLSSTKSVPLGTAKSKTPAIDLLRI